MASAGARLELQPVSRTRNGPSSTTLRWLKQKSFLFLRRAPPTTIHLNVLQYGVPMTSSVQSHLPSKRCVYERQCPLQEHVVSEDFGVVAGGKRSGWSHACTRFLDVSALIVEASTHAVLNVEASAHFPIWDVGTVSRIATRFANQMHCFAEAIVTRAEGLHRRHIRTTSHSAPDLGRGLLGAGFSNAGTGCTPGPQNPALGTHR